MAIDPSIPLMAQAPQTDATKSIATAYTLADMINQQKQQQAIRQALSQPGAVDPASGQVTPETLAAVTRLNPQAGMALQKNAADIAEKSSTTAKNNAQAKNFDFEHGVKQMDLIAQAGGALMTQYQQLIQQGVTRDQAIQKMQPLYQQSMERLADSKMIDQEHLAHIPPQFDPDKVSAGVFTALSTKDQFAVQHQQNQEALEQGKAQETQRHNRVEEGQGAARVGIEGENAATNRARLGFEESQPKTEVGKINADLNSGRISKDQANAALTKATGGGDPATVDEVAKHIADGSMQPLTSQALRTPAGMRIMARVYELNPNYDAKTYGTQAKALKDFATGKQGNTVRSLNVSLSHLDTLSDLSTALNNGNMQAVNKIGNQISAQTGSAAPTNFEAAKKIVADEIVKGIVGSGGGVSDREEAAKAISSANSPKQLAGVISTYKKLLGGQLEGLKKQYETSTGRSDFDKQFLSPAAQSLDTGAAPLPGQGPAPDAGNQPPLPGGGKAPPMQNAQGWTLHKDKNGNMAYVSPDGKQFQAVQ